MFWPVPNVDSVLVAFARDETPRGDEDERPATFQIIDAAFQQRRKMLSQALSRLWGGTAAGASEILAARWHRPTARGEALTIDDFHRIALAAG